ncbi:hypothetical protein FC093_23325 [Ilyomonas limi]|uniref:Uncharacterized protein n=1 Tax=Ilyomonas limi TaxID=2575867 RepID=A0A4U3KPH0_9BACT|nr:hypothetical protein [Ilyomonas limi]TKK64088.1 hypothetical protein FC093_23325 [Ilyomonas limi]
MTKKIKKGGRQFFAQQKLKQTIPHFKLFNGVLATFFFGSLLLTIREINIYEKTFIPFKIPFFIWVFTGLVFTPFFKRILTVYFTTPFLFLQIVYNIVTWGGLFVSAFMFANYYLADNKTIVINEKIISTGHLARGERGTCEEPFIIINYNGQEKQLVYYCDTQVEKYKSVDLTIAKGFLGYDIVTNSDLKIN